jgi:hypothetical protein
MWTTKGMLKTAKWTPINKGRHTYIIAEYENDKFSIRDDETIMVVKRNGKTVKRIDVGGYEEFEALFGIFWEYSWNGII